MFSTSAHNISRRLHIEYYSLRKTDIFIRKSYQRNHEEVVIVLHVKTTLIKQKKFQEEIQRKLNDDNLIIDYFHYNK